MSLCGDEVQNEGVDKTNMGVTEPGNIDRITGGGSRL